MGVRNAKADLDEYRKGYPNLPDDPTADLNYLFHAGKKSI